MSRGPVRAALATIGGGLRDLVRVRWVRRLLVVLGLVLVARLALGTLLSVVVGRTAERFGLTCAWDDLDLDLFGGAGELRGLVLRDADAPEDAAPLVELEYAVFDLQVLALLRGRLHVRRAEVDGLDAWLVRAADGRWNVGESLERVTAAGGADETPDADEDDGPAGPFDLSPPLRLDALRLQHAYLHLVDRAVEPPLDLAFEANVGLSRLADPTRPARLSASLLGGPLFEAAHVTGELYWTADGLDLTLDARAGVLHPKVLARSLESLDLRPVADSLEAALSCRAHVAVLGDARERLEASFELTDVRVSADGEEQLALDRLALVVESLGPDEATLPALEIGGVRGRAAFEEDGALRLVGVDVTGSAWADALGDLTATAPGEAPASTTPPAWLALLMDPEAEAFAWTLGGVDVRDVEVSLTDRRVEPAARFPLFVDRVHVGEVVHARAATDASIPIEVACRAPGLAETLTVTGSVSPFAPRRAVDLELVVDGIVLDGVQGHLERAGVERALERGRFRAKLVGAAVTEAGGRTTGELAVEGVALEDEGDLFGVQSIRATGLLLDPAEDLLRFGDVEVLGTRFAVGRDPSQRFFAFGLRTLGFSPTSGADAGDESSGEPRGAASRATPSVLPRIELGRFAWLDSDVELVDQAADPPRVLRIEELGLEVTGLVVGGSAGGPEHEPARVEGRLVAPGLVREATLEGVVRSRPGPLDLGVELALRVGGASGEPLVPYLRALGLEPTFRDATFAADVAATLVQEAAGLRVGVAVTDVALVEAGETLAACAALRVNDVVLAEPLEVGSVEVVAPRLSVARDDAGVPSALGLRLVPTPDAQATGTTPAEPTPLELPALPPLVVRRVAVEDVRVDYRDATVEPPVETELVLAARATDVTTDGEPGAFEAALTVPDTVARATATGTLRLASTEVALEAALRAEGVRAGPPTRLLPPGVELAAADGAFALDVTASVTPAADGGLELRAVATDLAWGEAGAAPWIAFARAELAVPRVDPVASVYELGPVTLDGLDVEAARDATGATRLLGLVLGDVPDVEPPTPSTKEEAEPDDADALAAAPAFLPNRLALVAPVRLELARASYRDLAAGPDTPPFVASATLAVEPGVAYDGDVREALDWSVRGALEDVVESWNVAGTLAPYVDEPSFEATFTARGVRTAGVVERVPALAELARGAVDAGTLDAHAEGTLFVRRLRPNELGLERPFAGAFTFDGLAYRDAPDGHVLAGVDRVSVELERADLARGLIHVGSVEVERPRAFVLRTADELHAAGFALATSGGAGTLDEDEQQVPAEAPGRPAEPPTGELRVDELVVQGLDVVLRDESVDPPLEFPLRSLDAEVTRFTTRAFSEPRALGFAAYLGVGEDAGAGRPLFDEVAVTGRVAPYPAPKGWVQVGLEALELKPLAPLAAASGLVIEDGALDANLRLRLKGERGVGVTTSLVFSDLDLDEPEGGVVQRVLSLPVALDSALFLLRNASGEHRFSLGVTLDQGGVSTSDVATAAAGAFTEVVASAVASAPLRVLGAVVPLGEDDGERPTWTLGFRPGVAELDHDSRRLVAAAVALAKGRGAGRLRVRHELTAADLARVETLANPTEEELLELTRGLRRRRAELTVSRDPLAKEVRALLAVGSEHAAVSTERLREHDRELAAVEASLDRLLEVLRNDSERHREKRTKATAKELADLRLEAVAGALRAGLPPGQDERVEVRSPRFRTAEGEGGGRVVIEFLDR